VRAEHGPPASALPAADDPRPEVAGCPEVQVVMRLVPPDILAAIADESPPQQVAELARYVRVGAAGPLGGVVLLGWPVAQRAQRRGAQVAEADDHAAVRDSIFLWAGPGRPGSRHGPAAP
jgi:hypothetical protein